MTNVHSISVVNALINNNVGMHAQLPSDAKLINNKVYAVQILIVDNTSTSKQFNTSKISKEMTLLSMSYKSNVIFCHTLQQPLDRKYLFFL